MNTGKILTSCRSAQQSRCRLYGLITFLENFWRNIAEKMLKKSWNRSEKRKLCKLKKRADARGASTQVHM